ncbi:hypothetical protein BRADI_4g21628v3 [Brachypodium distachyon]|uniref:Uncharacterized protein n=1 Tax=Brachypodium distachyon TaxID=15368 RepID=A0A2K2CP96_BRADI|nr:hypothetical protein BRADI_4g21628v3 [Brachypodium distachyon]
MSVPATDVPSNAGPKSQFKAQSSSSPRVLREGIKILQQGTPFPAAAHLSLIPAPPDSLPLPGRTHISPSSFLPPDPLHTSPCLCLPPHQPPPLSFPPYQPPPLHTSPRPHRPPPLSSPSRMASREATVARGTQISRPSHSLSLFLQPWRGAAALKSSCRRIRPWCPDLSPWSAAVERSRRPQALLSPDPTVAPRSLGESLSLSDFSLPLTR